MARRKGNNLVADRKQTLQLRSKVDRTRRLTRPALVKARDSNGISCCYDAILLLVIEYPRKHSIKLLGYIKVIFNVLYSVRTMRAFGFHNRTYKWYYNLTIGMCLELVRTFELLSE